MRQRAMRATIGALSLAMTATAAIAGGTGIAADDPTALDREAVEASLPALDQIVQSAMADTGVPGISVGVVFDDEVVMTRGYGVRSLDTLEPVDAETVFQIASLSKPVTSTAVAAVVGDGTIAWDDPVHEADPGFVLSDPWVTERVTYADLLAMRSGLPGQAGNELEGIGYTRPQILERLRLIDLAPFRDTYSYSNFGFTAAGEAAARALDTSWEELVQHRLFGPAGMTSTSPRHEDFLARTNRAELHAQVEGEWAPAFERMPDAQAPAGGVSSNVVDLARWVQLMLAGGNLEGERIVDSDALARATTPSIVTRPGSAAGDPAAFYGLGWALRTDASGRLRWGHSGAFSTGASTTAALVPDLGLGIVVLTNAQPVGVAEAIADAYLELLETGEITQDWVALWGERMAGVYGEPPTAPELASEPVPLRPLDAYTGTYSNTYIGDVEIIVTEDGLGLVVGPARRTYPLATLDGDTFSYVHEPEVPQFVSAVTFAFGPDDAARSVDISTFADFGYGTFDRS